MSLADFISDCISSVTQSGTLITVACVTTAAAAALGVLMALKADHRNKQPLPPGPTRYPILGSLPKLKGDEMFYVKLNELRKLHGDLIYLTLGAVKMVVVFGHDKVKAVLKDKEDYFKFRPVWLVEIKTLDLTNGIVWSNGQKNQHLRSFAFPALYPGVGTQTLEQRVQTEANVVVKDITEGTTNSSQLRLLFYKAICNINCSIIFGSRYEYTDPEFLELTDIMEKLLQRGGVKNPLNFFPVLQKLPQSKKTKDSIELMEHLKQFVHKQVEKSKETLDPSSARSLVDLYLLAQGKETSEEPVTEDNITHITRDLFVAGSENVAIGILWLVVFMMKYPDIQDKCRQTVTKTLGNTQSASKDDIDKLPYIYATLSEVLRLANIAPLSVPHSTLEEVELDGFQIPKDAMVLTHLESAHLDPKYWEEPEKFNPDRFIDEAGKFVTKEAFYPFSIGPRYCPAQRLAEMELFINFCTLLQNFRFEAPPGGEASIIHTQPGAFVEPAPFDLKCVRISE